MRSLLGGSIGGLLAARALVEHFDCVTVVERDKLPDDAAPRKGTPQARHVHGLLLRGAEAIERQLPGFGEDLEEAGARTVRIGEELGLLSAFGWLAPFSPTLPFRMATRDLIESVVRRRVRALPHVEFLDQHEVVGLVAAGGKVEGVRVSSRERQGAESELAADLVVDATGRGSRVRDWLSDMGFQAPEESVVDAFIGYSSRLYRDVAALGDGYKAVVIGPKAPEIRRAGGIYPLEDGLFIVTLMGSGRDYPPGDEEGFLEFARSLRAPHLYDAIRAATPASPISTSRSTANRHRHFERMPRWPRGFVAVGDAACAFNPSYGHGMTVAALQAELLGQMASKGIVEGRLFQRRAAKVIAPAWEMATLEDFRFDETVGQRKLGTRLVHRYMDAVFSLTPNDSWASERLVRVLQLLAPSTTLFAAPMLSRLARARLRGLARTNSPARSTRDLVTNPRH